MAATVRASTPGAMRIRRTERKGALYRRRVYEFLMFAGLWIVGFIAFQAYPLLQSLWISVAKLSFSGKVVKFVWVGLQNYHNALFVDAHFTGYLLQSVVVTVIQVPIIIAFALVAAVLMKQGLFGTTFFRGLFFLPVVIGSSAVMAQLLGAGGVPDIVAGRFMSGIYGAVGPQIAPYVTLVYQGLSLTLWSSGVQVLLILSGLYGVSPTYYEVARIDGASAWQTFLKVTLPVISPVLLLVTIYSLVAQFTNTVTNPVLNYISTTGLGGNLNLGLAGAMGWIYFIVIFIILLLIFRYSQNHVYYAGER
jgi:oligogalacturonide transport system permease protein